MVSKLKQLISEGKHSNVSKSVLYNAKHWNTIKFHRKLTFPSFVTFSGHIRSFSGSNSIRMKSFSIYTHDSVHLESTQLLIWYESYRWFCTWAALSTHESWVKVDGSKYSKIIPPKFRWPTVIDCPLSTVVYCSWPFTFIKWLWNLAQVSTSTFIPSERPLLACPGQPVPLLAICLSDIRFWILNW